MAVQFTVTVRSTVVEKPGGCSVIPGPTESVNTARGANVDTPVPLSIIWHTFPDGMGQPSQRVNVQCPAGDACGVAARTTMPVVGGKPGEPPKDGGHWVGVPLGTEGGLTHPDVPPEIEPEPEMNGNAWTWPADAGARW